MTAFKMYKAELRLTKLLKAPGGKLVSEQIAAAEQRLEKVRDTCVAALDERIEALAAAARGANLRETYAIASEIYGLAGTFALEDLTKAAGSLCDLMAACAADETPAADSAPPPARLAPAIHVHVEAMRTLRRPELSGDPQARAALLQGLAQVVARVGGPAR